MKFRSFTLIEMIIVIVIVSIMLLISLNISSNQTKVLRFKIAREAFITNYNSWLIRSITTNSDDIKLVFSATHVSNQIIRAIWTWSNSLSFEDTTQVKLYLFNDEWESSSPVEQTLSFNTKQWGCTLSWWINPIMGNAVKMYVKYRDDASVDPICYNIDLSSCKLKQCPPE